MAWGRNRAYGRDYADPLEAPPEPIGFWGLSERSERWARDEDAWGTSERAREAQRGRRVPRRREGGWDSAGGSWGRPRHGWGGARPYGAYERPPAEYGRGEERWREGRRRSRGEVVPSSRDEGTGAWGPGQAEPGLWGREPVEPRRRRPWYDRESGESRVRRARRTGSRDYGPQHGRSRSEWSPGSDITWDGWGYEWTGRRGRGRPDLREGEAWNEIGPGRWPRDPRAGR